jgi:hypothetical protein
MMSPAEIVRVFALAAALTAAWALLSSPTAGADFGAAALLSGTGQIQFDQADAPALARDGHYAAFQGSLASVSGVWRRNLQSGEIEAVIVEDLSDPAISAPDATAPSISANGQYIAFTTTADLQPETIQDGEPVGEPAADRGCPEVYVRDMDLPADAAGAYTLASALNDSGEGISFAGGCPATTSGFAIAGAQAAPAVALNEEGNEVAFTILSPSNLTGPCTTGTPPACPTPASQVVVRNLETDTTTLASVTPTGEATPGGGAFPSEESERQMHTSTDPSSLLGQQLTGSTAAISGDGSAVAWLGTDVGAQVPSAASEIEAGIQPRSEREAAGSEVEPLWRRIADGSAATTRRLLNGAGLDFFYNVDESAEYARGGSFVDTGTQSLFLAPALSDNGETVALTANAPNAETERSAYLSGETPTSDAYLVRVTDNEATPPQVTALTTTPDYDATRPALGFIENVAISPDGSRVAFDTSRSEFTLPTLALISPTVLTGSEETYEANLQLGTLQRVTTTWDGAPPSGSAGLLAFSGDGRALAVASNATNLFYGDAISSSQVYFAEELASEAPPAAQSVGSQPIEGLVSPEWTLSAIAAAQSNGSVLITAEVPAAGTLAVHAEAQLPTSAIHAPAKSAHSGRHRAKAKRAKTSTAAVKLLTRTVSEASAAAAAPGEMRLRLWVGKDYRSLVVTRSGLYTMLRVTFSAPGHATFTRQIPVTFRAAAKKPSKVAGRSGKAKSRTSVHGKSAAR